MLWTSTTRPVRGPEITASCHPDLVGRLRATGLAVIADLGVVGPTVVVRPPHN
ncbi:hypothetical protein [Streptomyces umbrinus]|uniref:hypothetical protein n=1 Tax=Streptomyces umbrinus TaxID=67370 RepID=UPI003C2F7395